MLKLAVGFADWIYYRAAMVWPPKSRALRKLEAGLQRIGSRGIIMEPVKRVAALLWRKLVTRKITPVSQCAALVFMSGLMILSGCVTYHSEPLSPETTASKFQDRSLSDPTLRPYIATNLGKPVLEWPLPEWNLTTLTLAAFYLNPELEVARAGYLVAIAGQTTAAQHPNPTVTVNPAFNSTTAVPSPWLVTASLDVPIETAGKRAKRQAHAAQLSLAAQFSVIRAAWDVRTKLRMALLEFWGAQLNLKLLREQQLAEAEMVRLLDKDQRAGGISPQEVVRARMASAKTQLALLETEGRQAQARTQLAAVIGIPPSALERVRLSLREFDASLPELPSTEARKRSLLSRTDVLGSLAEYEASQAALQLEVAKQYPDVHLSPGYEFDQGDNKWGLGLGVELPILNQNRGPIQEAQARRHEAAARFNALQARVLTEVETALSEFDNARRKLSAAAAILEQAQKQQRANESLFKAGEISRQTLASVRLESVDAARAQADARIKAQHALGALEAALESPLDFSVDTASLHTNIPSRP